jgi:hypothetical protein
MAARKAMMAIVTISSIKVNPRGCFIARSFKREER